jgi:hypothetical protein
LQKHLSSSSVQTGQGIGDLQRSWWPAAPVLRRPRHLGELRNRKKRSRGSQRCAHHGRRSTGGVGFREGAAGGGLHAQAVLWCFQATGGGSECPARRRGVPGVLGRFRRATQAANRGGGGSAMAGGGARAGRGSGWLRRLGHAGARARG